MNTIKTYNFGDIQLVYSTVKEVTSFTIVPTACAAKVKAEKFDLSFLDSRYGHVRTEPLVQVAVFGDEYMRAFTAGRTLKNVSTSYNLKMFDQKFEEDDCSREVRTYLKDERGLQAMHVVHQIKGYPVLECYVELENRGAKTLLLEKIDSFQLSGLTPFAGENDVENLFIHRMRSNWSAEGRVVSESAADLQLEDSWSSFGVRLVKFGQLGSMPARDFLPFVAVEDKNCGVTWAVTFEAPESWQIEVYHHSGGLSISGGLADFYFGHFQKQLCVGSTFTTRKAYLTVAEGDLLFASQRLVKNYESRLQVPKSEQSLPILYNEYCYSWGTPSMEKIRPLVDMSQKLGIEYFIMDAGWYVDDDKRWEELGDWNVNQRLFPNGLKEYADLVISCGMRPGIWYEFESVSSNSTAYVEHSDLLLTRGGQVVSYGGRSFWDFRKSGTIEYLSEKVIKNLKDNKIGYMKVDYNENIGVGVDGTESLGEGLRQQMDGVLAFYQYIKTELPDLVLEICSSGGMRHEPLFIGLGSMVSFSDAHEGAEGACIAMDLHRYILPRQLQIWATLKVEYGLQENIFTMAKAMLGRYCISGNIAALSSESQAQVEKSIVFYRKITNVIKCGNTTCIENKEIKSYRNMKGDFYLIRQSDNTLEQVVYVYAVEKYAHQIVVKGLDGYRVTDTFGNGVYVMQDGMLTLDCPDTKWFGMVFYMQKAK